MTALAGLNGKVMVAAATVAEIDKWSLDIGAEIIDISAFGDTWKDKVAGIKDWSGSFEGRWDMTDTTGQKALQDALLGGTTVTLKFYVNATNFYSGTAYVKALAPSAELQGTVDVSLNFEGTGALTYT